MATPPGPHEPQRFFQQLPRPPGCQKTRGAYVAHGGAQGAPWAPILKFLIVLLCFVWFLLSFEGVFGNGRPTSSDRKEEGAP